MSKILKNIPIPEKRRRGRPRLHRFDLMEPGDMMEISACKKAVYSCVTLFVKSHEPDWEFQLEESVKRGELVTKVWRKK
jgi:hypothetical protein